MVRAVTPIPFVKARFFDRCGKPLAGGKVYTYEANTTTPKVTYKDPYGLTPNTNPIILDAAGEADIYLDGTYRIRITDRNDVLINDVEKIGSWFSDNLQDTLNNVSSAMDDALKPILQNLDETINTAAAAAAGANGWTTDLVVENELTQKQINAVLFHNIYYAEREGISVNNTDNSTAWDNLHSRLNHGDEVIFGAGTYKFSRQMDINKVITVKGKSISYTQFYFYNQTHGIVRKIRGGYLSDVFINGTKSNVAFDFNNYDRNNLSVGNIGLYDKYDDTENFSGYTTTTNVSIQGFDVGRANVAEKTAIWNGAYRESYNLRINNNRCGLLVLNGATDEKYYGGVISANSDIGVWVYDDGGMYNNVKFMGTTIEGNGTYNQSIGYANASPTKCSIYVGGNSSVYLIGSYNEKCYNIVENGGQLYKIGSHQHGNAIDTTKGGYVYYSGINWGNYYKIPYYNRLSSFIYAFSGATATTVAGSKSVKITSQLNQSRLGYSIRSRLIPLPSGITADDVKGLKFSVKYKITSGFTQPTDLKFIPEIYVYAKDGSYAGTRELVWSDYQTTSGNGEQTEISIVVPIAVITTPANWNINKGAELSHVLISFTFKNADGSYPDFSTNNLDMTVDDLEVGIFARDNINLVEYRNKVGTAAERPLLIDADKGYKYFDTTLAAEIMWDGAAWVILPKMSDIPTVVTSATQSALSQKIATINTTNKTQGKLVFNVSDSKLYYATGTTPEAAWKASDGSSSITPV